MKIRFIKKSIINIILSIFAIIPSAVLGLMTPFVNVAVLLGIIDIACAGIIVIESFNIGYTFGEKRA